MGGEEREGGGSGEVSVEDGMLVKLEEMLKGVEGEDREVLEEVITEAFSGDEEALESAEEELGKLGEEVKEWMGADLSLEKVVVAGRLLGVEVSEEALSFVEGEGEGEVKEGDVETVGSGEEVKRWVEEVEAVEGVSVRVEGTVVVIEGGKKVMRVDGGKLRKLQLQGAVRSLVQRARLEKNIGEIEGERGLEGVEFSVVDTTKVKVVYGGVEQVVNLVNVENRWVRQMAVLRVVGRGVRERGEGGREEREGEEKPKSNKKLIEALVPDFSEVHEGVQERILQDLQYLQLDSATLSAVKKLKLTIRVAVALSGNDYSIVGKDNNVIGGVFAGHRGSTKIVSELMKRQLIRSVFDAENNTPTKFDDTATAENLSKKVEEFETSNPLEKFKVSDIAKTFPKAHRQLRLKNVWGRSISGTKNNAIEIFSDPSADGGVEEKAVGTLYKNEKGEEIVLSYSEVDAALRSSVLATSLFTSEQRQYVEAVDPAFRNYQYYMHPVIQQTYETAQKFVDIHEFMSKETDQKEVSRLATLLQESNNVTGDIIIAYVSKAGLGRFKAGALKTIVTEAAQKAGKPIDAAKLEVAIGGGTEEREEKETQETRKHKQEAATLLQSSLVDKDYTSIQCNVTDTGISIVYQGYNKETPINVIINEDGGVTFSVKNQTNLPLATLVQTVELYAINDGLLEEKQIFESNKEYIQGQGFEFREQGDSIVAEMHFGGIPAKPENEYLLRKPGEGELVNQRTDWINTLFEQKYLAKEYPHLGEGSTFHIDIQSGTIRSVQVRTLGKNPPPFPSAKELCNKLQGKKLEDIQLGSSGRKSSLQDVWTAFRNAFAKDVEAQATKAEQHMLTIATELQEEIENKKRLNKSEEIQLIPQVCNTHQGKACLLVDPLFDYKNIPRNGVGFQFDEHQHITNVFVFTDEDRTLHQFSSIWKGRKIQNHKDLLELLDDLDEAYAEKEG